MMKIAAFRGVCAALALAILCGCTVASPEKQLFDRVAGELDSGGSYYAVQNPVYLKLALGNLRKETENQIWNLPLPQEKTERIQLIASAVELFCRTSGLAEIEGVGASSVCVGDRQFRNTLFWALPENPQGVLWRMLPKENTLALSELEKLPENTALAGAVQFNPQSVEQKLKTLYPEAKALLSLPLLKELNGVWRFAVIADPECDFQTGRGLHIMLALPDPQKKIFQQLASILQLMPKTRIDRKNNRITLAPPPRKAMSPCGVQKNGTLFLFSSPDAEKLFLTPAKTLKERKDFQRAAALLRQPGVGVFYVQSSENLRRSNFLLNCGFDDASSIGVLERKPGGLKWSSCDPQDWNVSTLQALLVPTSMLIEPLIFAPEPQTKPAKKEAKKAVRAPNARPCLKQMKLLCSALVQYRKDHKNRFPEKTGIAGMRELQPYTKQFCCPNVKRSRTGGELSYANCDYLYFGNPGKDADLKTVPLLMERPGLHGDNRLIVGFADGHALKFNMEKPFSVRKAVSFLHTKYHYEENEFLRLMETAAEFDRILER